MEGSTFPDAPPMPVDAWKRDGIHLLEHQARADTIQLVVSAGPRNAPVDIARLLKGRLQHAMRTAGLRAEFSRKVSLRAIGENTRSVVEAYIRDQLEHTDLADPRYRASLQEHAFTQEEVDLAAATESNSGRYWYNLHVVLVTENRFRMSSETAGRISAACRLPSVAKCSVMPDHLHVAVKADPMKSPESVAYELQETTARAAGTLGFWKDTVYVGTFGEYGMGAVRS